MYSCHRLITCLLPTNLNSCNTINNSDFVVFLGLKVIWYRQWHLPYPFLLTFIKTWMDKPVFGLKFFQLLHKNKQTEVGEWHQISGELVSIITIYINKYLTSVGCRCRVTCNDLHDRSITFLLFTFQLDKIYENSKRFILHVLTLCPEKTEKVGNFFLVKIIF